MIAAAAARSRPGLPRPAGRRPWCAARSRTPARPADARSPRPAPAAGQRPAAAPRRSPAGPPDQPRTWHTPPAHAALPGPAGPPALTSCPYARPARPACGRSSSAATVSGAAASPAPRWTAASRNSAATGPDAPPARRSAPGLAPAPPAPPQAPGATTPPVPRAPHPAAGHDQRAHRDTTARQARTQARDQQPVHGSALSWPGRMADLTSYICATMLKSAWKARKTPYDDSILAPKRS
jgi:hypothetical protein